MFGLRRWIKTLALSLMLALLVSFPLSKAGLCSNGESFSVFTEYDEYVVGDTVNVYVKADHIDPNETITVTDVVVYDPSNCSAKEWHGLSIVLSDTTTIHYVGSLTVLQEGEYRVWAKGTGCLLIIIALILFWVCGCVCPPPSCVPEFPMGAEVLTLVALLGLSVLKRRFKTPK